MRRRTFIAAGVIAAFDLIPSSATKAQMRLSRVGFLHPRLSAIVSRSELPPYVMGSLVHRLVLGSR